MSTTVVDRETHAASTKLPGLVLVAVAVAFAYGVNQLVNAVSTLTVAVVLGVIVGHTRLHGRRTANGVTFASKRLLRAGVVLLGLQLAIQQLFDLRAAELTVIAATVAITFSATRFLGRVVGISRDGSLLIATGFSICGAAAVAAMSGVTRSKDEDVATAITLVTLYGSLAMVTLPLLQSSLGLDDHQFGLWVGGSVHEVAQVVAAGAVAGEIALVTAVVVKLGRVVLLAPLVAAVGLAHRDTSMDEAAGKGATRRPPIVPLFVMGFGVAVVARSTGMVPDSAAGTANTITTILLAAAMFGLGTGVHLPTLARSGGRALALGAGSTVVAAGVAYSGILLIG